MCWTDICGWFRQGLWGSCIWAGLVWRVGIWAAAV